MNLAQIRSAVQEIFHTQTKIPQTDGAKNRTFHSSLRAVINRKNRRFNAYSGVASMEQMEQLLPRTA